MFQTTMSNAIPERRMYFSCTEGTMVIELISGTLRYKCIGDEAETELLLKGDGHGGGDAVLMRELFDTMVNGTAPKCGGNEGLEGSVVALMLDKSAETGKIVDLEPVWKNLNR